jgi:Ca-activated chloride channel family protein
MLVGIKGYEIAATEIPAANIVFLIDTSGSMDSPDKIGLLKQSFMAMVPKLREQDRISIVVYAGSAGLVLPPTSGADHETILAAFDRLSAGGSTNGAAGIELAYQQAKRAFIENGVNRVILATDGDFNVGTVDMEALKTLVAEQRRSGVSLTTLGFGQGNYNDELSEQLADIGNGNHAYIDTLNEGHKVLVDEMSSTLFTIAKDVKIQVEFNPAVVSEYRLIGYENRMLAREDFNNDAVDAGEIGAGHDVTAIYEVVLAGSGGEAVDPLRYGANATVKHSGDELAFVKLRYKQPDAEKSTLIERPIKRSQIAREASSRLQFAAAVAAFADRLRGGEHLGDFDLAAIGKLANGARGEDRFGYQREFLELVNRAQTLNGEAVPLAVVAE